MSHRHNGMAYLMVMLALSVAGIIGVATIGSTALAVQSSATHAMATQAEFAAVSATQVGLFGLQSPSCVPTNWSATVGHKMFATGVPLPGTAGAFDLDAIATLARDTYTLTTIGHSATDASVTRGLKTSAKLIRAKPAYAGVFAAATTINSKTTFTGPILSNGIPTLSGTGTLNGNVKTTIAPTDFQIPSASTVNCFGAGASATAYVLPDGVTTGTPEMLSASLTTFPVASSTNPGHVFYRNGDLSISTTTVQTLNGTLVVKGNLTVTGINGAVTITPVSQMPALITTGLIRLSNKNLTVTVNGVVWTGSGIAWTAPSSGTSLQINGCLLVPAGATLASPVLGSMAIKFAAASVDVPDISTVAQPVTAVRVLSSAYN